MPRSPGGSTPGPSRRGPAFLHHIVKRGDLSDLAAALQHTSSAAVNSRDAAGRTPLLLAVQADCPEAVQLLIQSGAEPSLAALWGSTPLYEAAGGGRLACAELLLRAGARPNAFELTRRRTPLHQASAAGDAATAELLLRFSADANVPDYGHRRALHAAAEAGSAACVRLLVQHGARVNAADRQGLTPLDLARDADCQRALLEVEAALSPAGLRQLVRRSPAALRRLLDLGVQRAEDGGVQVGYKSLRDIGADCPFEAELVHEVARAGRWELVQHPAMELLFDLTRQDVYFTAVAVARVLSRVVLLGVLIAAMVAQLYHPEYQSADVVLKCVLVVLNSFRLMKFMLEIGFAGGKFCSAMRMWPELITTVTAVVAVCINYPEVKRIMYSIATLLAFLDLTLAIESISLWKTTIAISSFMYVTHTIIRFLVIFSPILLGFGVAFYILFGNEEDVFRGNFLVVNVAAMVLGNIDAGEIEQLSPQLGLGHAASNILITVFVVLVPLAMLNLLLALTISDTAKFLSKGSSEFLKSVALKTAWNQQAVFTLDRWVRKLDAVLPRPVFVLLATFTLRLKWRSTLPRPAASQRETPVIRVAAVTDDGKTMTASVQRWAAAAAGAAPAATHESHFSVRLSLQRRLFEIVERREDEELKETKGAEQTQPAAARDADALRAVSEALKEVQRTLEEQRDVQRMLVEQQRDMRDALAEQHSVIQMVLAELKNARST